MIKSEIPLSLPGTYLHYMREDTGTCLNTVHRSPPKKTKKRREHATYWTLTPVLRCANEAEAFLEEIIRERRGAAMG